MSEEPHVKAMLNLDISHFDMLHRDKWFKVGGVVLFLLSSLCIIGAILLYKYYKHMSNDEQQMSQNQNKPGHDSSATKFNLDSEKEGV